VKHGTVIAFSVIVIGVYWWSRFGEVSVETQLERIYSLTPLYLCLIFGLDWYRSKDIEERLKKLESAAAELDDASNQKGD
jgi:hypothetical protein